MNKKCCGNATGVGKGRWFSGYTCPEHGFTSAPPPPEEIVKMSDDPAFPDDKAPPAPAPDTEK